MFFFVVCVVDAVSQSGRDDGKAGVTTMLLTNLIDRDMLITGMAPFQLKLQLEFRFLSKLWQG